MFDCIWKRLKRGGVTKIQKSATIKLTPQEDFMKYLRFISLGLVIAGALNYGMMSIFGMDVLSMIFGSAMGIIAFLIGLAGLYTLSLFSKCWGCGCDCGSKCKCCKK
jgi:uncharacterized protein